LNNAFSKVLLAVSLLAGVLAFAMMWLIDINAVSRKLFNLQIPGAVELTQSLLTIVIMLPFGYVLFRGEHVGTSFLTTNFPAAVNRWLRCAWMLVGFLLFACVSYGTFQFALRSFQMNEQVWGATVRFPVYPAKFAVSLGALLICIQFAIEALLLAVTPPGANPSLKETEEREILDV
jgi:TRAP-type C4-dicarboxylate transport system permease small subunit